MLSRVSKANPQSEEESATQVHAFSRFLRRAEVKMLLRLSRRVEDCRSVRGVRFRGVELEALLIGIGAGFAGAGIRRRWGQRQRCE